LQGRFEGADVTLDEAKLLLERARPRAKVRWLLERGRVRNSSGRAADAVPLFEEAWNLAIEAGEDALAVDAAHMLGIAEAPSRQLDWHERAISLAQESDDPKVNAWLGSLLNNRGWTLHDAGRYNEALTAFERALAWREERGQARETQIARWAVARCLRSLGRFEEALAIQEQLRAELDAAAEGDSYVDEELLECRLALGADRNQSSWTEVLPFPVSSSGSPAAAGIGATRQPARAGLKDPALRPRSRLKPADAVGGFERRNQPS
jgi:tetratricopeptide (TPR) repeat protein